MTEEYLDIVNEKGNLTGKKELRTVCHEKGLCHQTVHIYFYRNSNGIIEILPHLRSKFKASNPNCWDTRFGGHVEAGQTVDEAAWRELQEETGLEVDMRDLLTGPREFFDGGKNKEFVSAFYYNFNNSLDKLSFNDGEVQEVKWMNFDEIEKSMTEFPEKWSGSVSGLKIIKEDLLKKIA